MSESSELIQPLRRDVKVLTMKLLSALKDFYTFKELEEILGVSYQTLWRYTNFLTTPEEGTAKKLIQTIRERRLVESTFEKNFAIVKNLSDIWTVVKNIGFLDLVAFETLELLNGEDIDGVLAFPEESGVLGAVIAHWIRGDVCVTTKTVSLGEALIEYYKDNSMELNMLAVSRGCIPKKGRVVLATLVLNNKDLLEAAFTIVKKSGAQPIALVAVFAVGKNWKKTIENLGLRKYKIFNYLSLEH
ncbi:MAG: hypothetical protein RMH84_03690 [Sulfolobales archaeon]|nr:hypothetical protein [Sulfolobales archaeon]MCX8208126.1 hypothetical protein [Sulfolobales archaeon]MDW8010676.1 hypothetical protein [Sulfolobales archaeon]